jgi:hypothetical protein
MLDDDKFWAFENDGKGLPERCEDWGPVVPYLVRLFIPKAFTKSCSPEDLAGVGLEALHTAALYRP